MAAARIYQKPKNATQSGYAGTDTWVLEFEPADARRPDPLMGWVGSSDTRAQVRLNFPSREDAVAFAERNGIAYGVELPHARKLKVRAYADNFRFGRVDNWTH
jgi:hypothetical protein